MEGIIAGYNASHGVGTIEDINGNTYFFRRDDIDAEALLVVGDRVVFSRKEKAHLLSAEHVNIVREKHQSVRNR